MTNLRMKYIMTEYMTEYESKHLIDEWWTRNEHCSSIQLTAKQSRGGWYVEVEPYGFPDLVARVTSYDQLKAIEYALQFLRYHDNTEYIIKQI